MHACMHIRYIMLSKCSYVCACSCQVIMLSSILFLLIWFMHIFKLYIFYACTVVPNKMLEWMSNHSPLKHEKGL